MNAHVIHPLIVQKEQLVNLHFPACEVLNSSEEIKQRIASVKDGLLLGNSYKNKVGIIFEDSESLKEVITTIWGVTDMHIILKCGTTIPLNRVYNIEVYP